MNDKYFLNVAHIGLGVEVKRQLSPDKKRLWTEALLRGHQAEVRRMRLLLEAAARTLSSESS
ncbi:MAG: hypothetical protein AB1640_08380 [bacterium]